MLKKDLPKEILRPLLEKTIANAKSQHPKLVQTGPALRDDENTKAANTN